MRKHAKSARQVAYALGLPPDASEFIERQAEAGEIPSIVLEGKRLFDVESVDRALAKMAAETVTPETAKA